LLTQYRINRIKEIDTVEIISVRTSQLVFKFYEKFGFVLKEIAKDYWAEGLDMYRMEME
jgi:[ribosomal protein S18]-alanine N-acetyltransferase